MKARKFRKFDRLTQHVCFALSRFLWVEINQIKSSKIFSIFKFRLEMSYEQF